MQNRREEKPIPPLVPARRVAEGQQGFITLPQTRECGISKDMLHRLVASGELTRVLPGVFRVFSSPDEWVARCTAVGLWLGDNCALSFRAAAAWWNFDTFDKSLVEFSTTSKRTCPLPDVILHRVSAWRASDRGRAGSLWVTSPTRTLLDLAAVSDRDDVEMALESALRRKLTSIGRIQRSLESRAGRGRAGTKELRRLLAIRGPDARPTESPMETRFIQFLRRWRLPIPIRQHVIMNGRRRFDFFYPHAQLLIEFDSYEHHSGRKSWNTDKTKRNGATVNGLRTFTVTKELMDDAPKLARDLRRALGQDDLF